MSRTRAWLAVSPIVAAGVLVAHALAYRLTSTPAGPAHDYLEHAPQILLLLALVGVALAGLGSRLRAPAASLFPVAALATFVLQEHLERLVHGELPFLLASPVFFVGLVLQVPVALVVRLLARRLLDALGEERLAPRVFSHLVVSSATPRARPIATFALGAVAGRGPPA